MGRVLKAGDRVRMKVRTVGGWNGTGTVVEADSHTVKLHKDGVPLDEPFRGEVLCCPHEVSKCRAAQTAG